MRISDWSSDVCSSDLIPREQPIRDNLEAIEERSRRIDRMLRITAAIRPEIEECVEALFGGTFFLDRPTPARLAVWRAKAQERAARQAGFAYAAYGHLKLLDRKSTRLNSSH